MFFKEHRCLLEMSIGLVGSSRPWLGSKKARAEPHFEVTGLARPDPCGSPARARALLKTKKKQKYNEGKKKKGSKLLPYFNKPGCFS